MAKQSILDKYPQRVVQELTIPAANGTGAAPTKFSTSWNPKDALGLLIQRVKYNFDASLANLDAILDQARFGLCVVNAQPTYGLDYNTAGVIDFNRVGAQYGTLVGLHMGTWPIKENNFAMLSGGGIICHPASLYCWSWNDSTAALAAAVNIKAEVYYTLVELSPADWQELWQFGFITQTT